MRLANELPDMVTFNSLNGGGCAKQGAVEKADDVCKQIKSASELPDEVKFSSSITRHGVTNKTEEVCEKMMDTSAGWDWQTNGGVHFASVIYNTYLA